MKTSRFKKYEKYILPIGGIGILAFFAYITMTKPGAAAGAPVSNPPAASSPPAYFPNAASPPATTKGTTLSAGIPKGAVTAFVAPTPAAPAPNPYLAMVAAVTAANAPKLPDIPINSNLPNPFDRPDTAATDYYYGVAIWGEGVTHSGAPVMTKYGLFQSEGAATAYIDAHR